LSKLNIHPHEAFQVNPIVARRLAKRKRRIARLLRRSRHRQDSGWADLPVGKVTYEVSDRVNAVAHGGLGVVHQLVSELGVARRIDEAVHVLKVHRPYHESDHVLNVAYNALCGGRTLEDLELRRNDEAHLNALGVQSIPDPTTAGDFCRRFAEKDIDALQDAFNAVRVDVWRAQDPAFFQETACIDVDGSIVATTGECKEGMALSYKGVWGYHPLLVSLANTGEPLFLANRSGNEGSHTGAAAYLDRAIDLVREAGFTDVLLRGDTDFSQTKFLDGWHDQGARFVFGYDARKNLTDKAAGLSDDFSELARRAKTAFIEVDLRRAKPIRHKEAWVRAKGYKNIVLKSEDIAEFDYQPQACTRPYRMVVLRKNLSIERGETVLMDDVRYFFYITNDRDMSARDVVYASNDRCNQENLIEQLKNGVRALHAPTNTLLSNWAYMVMTSLAWSIKAWMALRLPVSARWKAKHIAERRRWLRMEFRSFLNEVILVPAQILQSGRRRIWRLLAWRPQLPTLLRLLDAL
jgi:hypothetical protein